jgi:TonB-dependent starch-binding outer membrane protein SusC
MSKSFIYLIFILLPALAVAQNRTVTGVVTSASDNLPLPGVSVVVKNTTKGTVTDIDGKYSLDLAPGEGILDFSYVGHLTQSITVGDQSQINVILAEDAKVLDEVVVVGYGIQRKSDITGSTATVGGAELTKQPVLTATQAMQGKVAGVQIITSGQPGSSPQVRIRGVGTALGGTTALYVVDGVLTDDISNINTSDIVDMSVLKDASAAAIYGSRGANGVIIITTKKGAIGDLKINYNNNIGIRQAANLVEMANAAEYSNYVQAATGTAPASTGFDTDWYNTILRNAWQQSHNISLSGGTEKATHFFNVGYLKDQGILLNNEFERLTLRLNEEYKITKAVKFGFQSSYGNSTNQNSFGNITIDAFGNIGSAYNNAYRASPLIADEVDGRYGNTSAYQNVGNPLLDLNNNDINIRENRVQGSAFLEVKPFEWLTLRSAIGGDWKNTLGRGYFTQFNSDEETFLIAGGNQGRANSSLNVRQAQGFRWVWDNTATATKQFGKHDVTLLIGTTAEKFRNHIFAANRNDVPADPNLWYINVGDANSSQNSGEGDAWARNSYLARLNYSFDEKYLFTATVRTDGSSRLPGQNRWQQFPSFGAGWILSREGFMQNQNLFDLLKLRASYGRVGNDQIPTDAYTRTVALNKAYAFNGSSSAATNGAQINTIIDPNITWELTEEFDVALEFGVLESRLTGEVNYYDKKVENALIRVPIPKTVGDLDATVITNVASIQNKGIEFVLNWKNRVNDNFSYSVGANATLNDNKVVALNGGQAVLGGSIGASQGFTTRTDNGHPVGSFYVLEVDGVFNSGAEVTAYKNSEGTIIQPTAKAGSFRYVDQNDDGKIDDLDRVFAGSYQPVAYFGVNAAFNYKKWDFSIDFYGNVGNEVYNGKRAVRVEGKDNVERSVVYDRWTSGNQTQEHPAANIGNLPASDYFVESGAFARINNLTVGYTFPTEKLARLRMTGLRIFATSQNLFTLKKYSGFTPELPGDPTNSGIELSAYPTTRTIAAGLSVGF